MKTEGTVPEAAKYLKWDRSYVRALCTNGCIQGARKIGRDWIIPWPPKVLDKRTRWWDDA